MKKQYMNPVMRVVEIKHKCQILAGSDRVNQVITNSGFSFDTDGLEDCEGDM